MLLKNALIVKPEFIAAFSNLMTIKMPAKQCLEISACIEDLLAQNQIVSRARKAIADKYCEKKEDGRPQTDPAGNLVFQSDEIKKKFIDEINEIHEEEIDILLSSKIKISSKELMTPATVMLLKDIIEIVDDK